ncbi:hypothetical protein [Zoogloea sp.]|uniref:hypothetical protein n=1 Tax=Zoogloea sp. TaxID=49181 RepID=UPI0025F2E8CF|nr:hypothetical protein [Zoogloea sp.]MCK6393861.1 hypothetical protein [Zoogloea sp.]
MPRVRLLGSLMLAFALSGLSPAVQAGDVVLIAHPSVPRLDRVTVERIYTGKVVEVAGVRVTPIDLPVGDAVRNRFLVRWVSTDEERYTAYWTVRRYVGKGVPPREVVNAAEVSRLVAALPGGVGYIDEADLRPGVNVVAR